MINKNDAKATSKPRRTIQRSAEHKAKLSAASALLAEKMEEKRKEWVSR